MDSLKSAWAGVMLAALFSTAAYGSVSDAERWGYGPLAGVNFSGADLGGPEDRGIAGWAFGGRVQMDMTHILSVATDPMFIRTGAEFDPDGESFEARGQFYLVEVPMFLKARMDFYNVGLYAFAGPNATLLWDASGQLENGHHLDNSDANWGAVSGDIGVGSSFAVAPRLDLTADARYSHAFTDLLDTGVGEVDSWRSRDVRLVLGVLLRGG